jgi:glycerol-3-phosphate dehydrogenase
MEALHERGILRENAPHLVHDLAFVVPNYEWWEAPFYRIGLRLYDLLAGKYGFGKSRNLSREETLERIPTLRTDGLRGGVVYYDGQFDDSRLLIHLVWTAVEQGAAVVNYCRAETFAMESGVVAGVAARDMESGETFDLRARVVINATGAFSDGVRRAADPSATPMIAPSQGAHIVLDQSFLPGDSAIMVPHTSDGRVMFAIPWHGHTLVGTTDTPVGDVALEPRPLDVEIDFIIENAARYLHHAPCREDVLSAFAGIRPLVKSGGGSTAALSRDHSIHIDSNGLLTIAGGKWTTYRHMAEDCVNRAAMLGGLTERDCVTRQLRLHGFAENSLSVYGSDAASIAKLGEGTALHSALPYTEGEVIWAVREEMARTVEDVLARRTRALLLNARAAMEMAPRVAEILASELGCDTRGQLAEFLRLAAGYLPERDRSETCPT